MAEEKKDTDQKSDAEEKDPAEKEDTEDDAEDKDDADDTKDEDDDGDDDGKGDDSTDTKTLLEIEKARRIKAEQAAADASFKLRQKNRKKADEDSGNDDDLSDEERPLTAREMRSILAEQNQRTEKRLMSRAIQDKAIKLAGTDANMAELIINIHANRTFPDDLSIDEQLEEAYAIANRKKIVSQNEELKRSLRGKNNAAKGGAEGAHRDAPKGNAPKLSDIDKTEMSRLGFSWDGKYFVKKLSNGKTLFKDWKAKKTWVK